MFYQLIRGFLERGLLSVVCREKVQSKGKPQYSTEKGWVDLFVYLTFVVSWFYQMANNDPEWPHVISAEKEPFGNQGDYWEPASITYQKVIVPS